VKRRILKIARASRDKSEKGKQKLAVAYGKLLDVTSRAAGQAKKFSAEISAQVKLAGLVFVKNCDSGIPCIGRCI
jgi:hypothetical protein